MGPCPIFVNTADSAQRGRHPSPLIHQQYTVNYKGYSGCQKENIPHSRMRMPSNVAHSCAKRAKGADQYKLPVETKQKSYRQKSYRQTDTFAVIFSALELFKTRIWHSITQIRVTVVTCVLFQS